MENERGKIEVSGYDVFELLQLTAAEVNFAEAQRDQKNPGRLKFIADFLETLKNYFSANDIIRPDGYEGVLKSVLHSKTAELLKMIKACQEGQPEIFAETVSGLDMETLRRMGKLLPQPAAQRSPLEASASLRAQSIDVFFTHRDVRSDTTRNRNLGFN